MFRVLTFFFVSLEKRRHREQFFFVLKSGYFSSFFITFLYSLLSEPNDGQKRARDDEDCVASFLFFSHCVCGLFFGRAQCVCSFFSSSSKEKSVKKERFLVKKKKWAAHHHHPKYSR